MQCRKQSSTLRVSPKGEKTSPKIIYHEGIENIQIKAFLEYRELIKDILRDIDSTLFVYN